MKKMITILAFLIAGQANALECSLYTQNPKAPEGQFDFPIFENIEVLKNNSTEQVMLVKPDGTLVEDMNTIPINNEEDLKALDKSIVVFFSKTDEQTLGMGLASVDASHPDDGMPIDSFTLGSLGKILNLVDFKKQLSLLCMEF